MCPRLKYMNPPAVVASIIAIQWFPDAALAPRINEVMVPKTTVSDERKLRSSAFAGANPDRTRMPKSPISCGTS
eukprot:scaffold325_cov343-Pavlova_lutheri.AAC.9